MDKHSAYHSLTKTLSKQKLASELILFFFSIQEFIFLFPIVLYYNLKPKNGFDNNCHLWS